MKALFAASMLALGCSSSSSESPSPIKDSAVVDGSVEAGSKFDQTTGLVCTTDNDCDKSGNDIAHCTNVVYAIGPLNPTSICVQFSSKGDACEPTDDKTIRFCDNGLGLCTKSGTSTATCEGMCIMNADGTFVQKCAGKNACNVSIFGTDSLGALQAIGTCQGGCRSDADCTTGSKCDPLQHFCAKDCTKDADCTKGWVTAPDDWKCDTARGACTFVFPKKPGEECTDSADCLCFRATGAPAGYCVSLCREGDDCGAGFTCDLILPRPDFTFEKQPSELAGYCLKNCSDDSDCPAMQKCARSAGLTQKTCRPAPATADAG